MKAKDKDLRAMDMDVKHNEKMVSKIKFNIFLSPKFNSNLYIFNS